MNTVKAWTLLIGFYFAVISSILLTFHIYKTYGIGIVLFIVCIVVLCTVILIWIDRFVGGWK